MTSDIRMYHELKEQAKKMADMFAFHEMVTYQKCIYYHYDGEACECSCSCPKINRLGKDFDPEKECWSCDYYSVESKEIKDIEKRTEPIELENYLKSLRESGSLCGALMAWEDGNDWEFSKKDQCPHCDVEQPCQTWHMFHKYYIESDWTPRKSDSTGKEPK